MPPAESGEAKAPATMSLNACESRAARSIVSSGGVPGQFPRKHRYVAVIVTGPS